MKFSKLIPSFKVNVISPDENSNITFDQFTEYGFFYKSKYIDVDFKGNKVTDDLMRVTSIWRFDSLNKTVSEIVPFGNYDIQYTLYNGEYLYFVKEIDRDGDGIIAEDEYQSGQIWRVDLHTRKIELCFDLKNYKFHGFEIVNEQYIVFCSEDCIPYTTQYVFVDLQTKRFSELHVEHYEDSANNFDFTFEIGSLGYPEFVIARKCDGSESSNISCYLWSDFVQQLSWNEYSI